MTIAVIGLGGAGGNIANEAAKIGIVAGAINFSNKDLDALDQVKYKLKLPGSDGVGHDRLLAIELMQEHYAHALKFMRDHFSNPSIDIIFLPFASSGGSGSGIAPLLCELLTVEMNKVIVPMPILPDESEVLIAQANAFNAMIELSRLDMCILPLDNNQVKIFHASSKNKLFEVANTTIIQLLDKVNSYTQKASKFGNFDHRDLITTFSQKGMAAIAEVAVVALAPKTTISKSGITDAIVRSWEESIFAPIEFDQVAKCGFIFDGQEMIMEYIDYSLIFSKFKHGVPLDIFEGYYEEHNGRVITILSGLPWCSSRMEQIGKIIEQGREKAERVIENMQKEQYQAKTIDFGERLRGGGKSTNKPEKESVMEILGRFRGR